MDGRLSLFFLILLVWLLVFGCCCSCPGEEDSFGLLPKTGFVGVGIRSKFIGNDVLMSIPLTEKSESDSGMSSEPNPALSSSAEGKASGAISESGFLSKKGLSVSSSARAVDEVAITSSIAELDVVVGGGGGGGRTSFRASLSSFRMFLPFFASARSGQFFLKWPSLSQKWQRTGAFLQWRETL